MVVTTARLRLVPVTMALARAEINDRGSFAQQLRAIVPDNWPPESLADALPLFLQWLEAAPDCVGWFGWYALHCGAKPNEDILVGSAGFKGPPQNNTVEIGYSVLPQYQRRGYAMEMVTGLANWAFRQSDVVRIIAETELTNLASQGVLAKVGFTEIGQGEEANSMRYELRRPA